MGDVGVRCGCKEGWRKKISDKSCEPCVTGCKFCNSSLVPPVDGKYLCNLKSCKEGYLWAAGICVNKNISEEVKANATKIALIVAIVFFSICFVLVAGHTIYKGCKDEEGEEKIKLDENKKKKKKKKKKLQKKKKKKKKKK